MTHIAHTHNYRPGEHRSRREIDMALGVVMGIRRCSAKEALEVLAGGTRASGVGLGGVSRALLSVVSGDPGPAVGEAVTHWNALLGLPAHLGSPAHRGD